MVSDSTHQAVYASGGISIGAANQTLRDVVFSSQLSIHQAHTYSHFQFFYGATAIAGNYHIAEDYNAYNYYGSYPGTSIHRGNRFFAGLGAFAGADIVIPFRTGSEWRVIGVETNFQREFGDYQQFRSELPDSAAEAITRSRNFQTIGITTNVIKKFRRSGNSFGYKFGVYVGTQRTRLTYDYYNSYIVPVYISNTLHLTRQRVTGFAQINAGTYALNFQTGINVRL